MSSFELSTWIAAPLDAVFDLARSLDAHRDSMAASGEEAVGAIRSGLLGEGEAVTWRARHFGFTFHMTSRITEYERPHRFVDEQVNGPFKSWWHLHTFVAEDGGTRMVDEVRYTAPMGFVGRVVDRVFLERYMRSLIAMRSAHLKKHLEDGN